MWIKIKDSSGGHLIQTTYDIATTVDGAYAFMYEWDVQRIRAYCRERSLILEEDVKTPPTSDFEKTFNSITYMVAGVTGMNPKGVYGKEEELVTHVQNELNSGATRESVKYRIMRGFAMKYIPEYYGDTLDKFIEVMVCPIEDVPLYINDRYPVNSIASKRLEIGK